jgi:hypothetical protein
MTDPMAETGLVPASILKIQADPTSWGLRTVRPHDPRWDDGPVAIDIMAPVAGTLILSPALVGSFALTPVIENNGWHPGPPIVLVAPYLYIPTATGLKTGSAGYPLAEGYYLPDLRRSIIDAMTTGSTLSVKIDVFGGGVVVLNGAQLPFAVLAEVQTN